jgi:membrane protein DedA with SNARE-associated domain
VAADTVQNRAPGPWRAHRKLLLYAIGGLVVLLAVVVVLHRVAGSDGFSLVSGDSGSWTYFMVFLLVYGDGVCMVLPGETTLNAASALAAQGQLSLGLVMLAGALGAIGGDVTVYAVARKYRQRVMPQYEKAKQNDKVATALEFMGDRAPILIVAGRYVPGLRWVVNATMGLQAYPWKRFLLWDAIGGTLWSVYTCGLAYLVATALSQFPLASIIISGLITTAVLAALFIVVRRSRAHTAEAA